MTHYKGKLPAQPERRDTFLGSVRLPQVPEDQRETLEGTISLQEIKRAIRVLPRGHSPGGDGLPVEFYTTYEDTLAPPLHNLFAVAREMGSLPPSIREVQVIPLLKPGRDPTLLSSYRPISLLSTEYKILSKIIAERILPIMQNLIHSDQCKFIPQRNTSMSIRRLIMVMVEAPRRWPNSACL